MDTGLHLVKVHGLGGYDSDFSDSECEGTTTRKKDKRKYIDDDLLKKPFQKEKYSKVAHKQVAVQEWDREEARNRRFHLIAMDAFSRHKKFVNDYILYYGGKKEEFRRSTESDKTDLDIIRENHRFLWNEQDEEDLTWEKKLAKKYYDKLFKEYCIADLSRYKENKFGFRWRIEKEVIAGKGQFFCGNKRCEEKEGLKSWEVNFAYVEHGEKRNALVKLRLCPECSYKLNYSHRRNEVKPDKKYREQLSLEQPPSKKSKSSHMEKHQSKSRTRTSKDQSSPDQSHKLSEAGKESEHSEEDDETSDAEYWKGPSKDADEKTREEEFDDYFQGMFL